MVLIYSHTTSPRLQYIADFIFGTLMASDYRITTDSEEYRQHDDVKINYTESAISDVEIHIPNHPLLFESDTRQQDVSCITDDGIKMFFASSNGTLLFDIFAASFYLITRYEEYLPHTKDIYGRYAYEQSIAFRENFLHLPLVNIWVKHFVPVIRQTFPHFSIKTSSFSFLPTYDIDIAYSYRHKGLVRNLGGALLHPSWERYKVLAGLSKDPYDSYGWLHQLHKKYQLRPLYFFLVAEKNALYDKNILPHKKVMWDLVRKHAKKYEVGLHPSWQSGDRPSLLLSEKEQLESMAEIPVTNSRQHYIRFNLPGLNRWLLSAGIKQDYSMGYGSINGFRASVASSFYWFDLEKNEPTDLTIHPFCFMDANSFYEQKNTPERALEELMHYASICKTLNANLITIWHNHFLGTEKVFRPWREMYEKFIAQITR